MAPRAPSRTPFTSLSQLDADLALARALQEQAFLSFCEGCEVDVHLFFEKAGEPILMAPRFGFDDGTNSDFDVTLVLATMLVSQLNETNASDQPNAVPLPQESDVQRNCSQSRHARASGSSPASEHPSNHTKIWSDLSGPAASEHCRERQAPVEQNPNQLMFDFVQRPDEYIKHTTSNGV